MASRALIIAIENYPRATGGLVEQKLTGVIAAAVKFQTWLEKKWATEQADSTQLIFCSEPKQPTGRGASWQDLYDALQELKRDGQGMTDELFVYFSGHGFRFEDAPGSRTDVLVASDFSGNGNLCFKLDEIVTWLRAHLGQGRHYYFIDACRNVLKRDDIRVSDNLPWKPNAIGEATCYVLQSTVSGSPALVAGPFAASLLAGLQGQSRAKVWAADAAEGMVVRYDSLRMYLQKKLANEQPITNRVDADNGEGESDVIFTRLQPPPESTLKIALDDLPAGQQATLTLRNLRTQVSRQEIISDQIVLPCLPDNYVVEVNVPGGTLEPSNQQAADLFEAEQNLRFRVDFSGLEAMAGPPLAEAEKVAFAVAAGAQIELRSIDDGQVRSVSTSDHVSLPHGRYEAVLKSHTGTILRKESVEVSAETSGGLNPIGYVMDTPQAEIEQLLSSMGTHSLFSESLGPMDDPDLSLWLTLLGGGRIIGSNGCFSKLSHLNLHDFSQVPPGGTACYVLAGFAEPQRKLRVALGEGPEVAWEEAVTPADLPSTREACLELPVGAAFLSLHVEGIEPLTVATCALPNRVTLVVVTLNSEGEAVVHQFVLPLGHLISHLDPQVSKLLENRTHLRDLKFLAQAARAFRKRRKLTAEFTTGELHMLLEGKWLDPVGAAMAAYECVRRGDHSFLITVARNLQTYFPEFPDGPAIAALAERPIPPVGVPLFLDGWLALRDTMGAASIPAGSLDYSSALTTWLGAVRV